MSKIISGGRVEWIETHTFLSKMAQPGIFLKQAAPIIISSGIHHLFSYLSVPTEWSLNREIIPSVPSECAIK